MHRVLGFSRLLHIGNKTYLLSDNYLFTKYLIRNEEIRSSRLERLTDMVGAYYTDKNLGLKLKEKEENWSNRHGPKSGT